MHGDEFLGFGRLESMIADLWDLQVRVAVGKKWKSSMVYPRPSVRKATGRSLGAVAAERNRVIDVSGVIPGS